MSSRKIEVSESAKSVQNQFVALAHQEQIAFVKNLLKTLILL